MSETTSAQPRAIMRTALRWDGGLSFQAAGMGGTSLRIDQPVEKGGGGEGFKPMELLLLALASCMATTLVPTLAKQHLQLDGYEIALTGERATAAPMRFTRIVVEHRFRGAGLGRSNLERLVALVDEKYCSVAATLPRGLVEHRVIVPTEAEAEALTR